MITVYSKEELEKALKAKEKHILIKGTYAENLKKQIQKKKNNKKKLGITSIAIAAASLAAIPFTGGTSIAAGATYWLTAGGLTISAAELAIIGGFSLAGIALLKGYRKVKFNPDGSVELEK